jgi:hypothetical protein
MDDLLARAGEQGGRSPVTSRRSFTIDVDEPSSVLEKQGPTAIEIADVVVAQALPCAGAQMLRDDYRDDRLIPWPLELKLF